MRIAFGVANVYFNPLTGNIPTLYTPQQAVTLQDFSIDIDATIKELRGQYQFPDDTAYADRKMSWKSGTGRFDIDLLNNIVFGEAAINTGGFAGNVNEAHTIPASSPYSIETTNFSEFSKDLGVLYTSGPLAGQKLTKVYAANPTGAAGTVPGEYYESSGSYLFGTADASLTVNISYTSTVTSGRVLTVQNHTQGYGPGFEVYAFNPYQELTPGVPNYVHLYACKLMKTGAPFKRADYEITPLEGEAYANASGFVADFYED